MSQRTLELDALLEDDLPEVADRSVRRNQLLGGGLIILCGLVAGYLVTSGPQEPAGDMLGGEEEFTTTVFRPPSFMHDDTAKTELASPAVIELPQPPAPPKDNIDTTQFDVPPPPVTRAAPPPPQSAEPSEAAFPERYRSAMIVFDGEAAESGTKGLQDNEGEGSSVAGEDRASRFLATASNLGDRSAKAKKIERIDALVPEGTLIAGILETSIISDLPGQVRAIVSQDVYSFDGRRILIPTGTRLVGEYQSEMMQGQTRIFVVWTRLLRDDGVTVRLNSIGADGLGRAGLTGQVDKKFRERFGAAILLSVVGGGASYLAGAGSRAATSGNGAENPEEIARAAIAQTFSDMANQTLGDSLKVPPTIRVSQGERLFVFVRQDLDFSALYDDPVTEALKDIRRERGLD
ncbi:conjugal transfer protein TrbI [Mesorhizobium sp. Root157]|uniref:type IV secretion system protein VirB10 n=1 Tax=Mesorhizobium sp. Root157 TaxID=1736477 RepID=UPI0006F4128D|nr:type IV secretion system protein VirB10 [Mesorhizobium sp. Root157]KQZ95891.1 conjugal transfer protein TrbI [Mesorhizobium sp. Root157]